MSVSWLKTHDTLCFKSVNRAGRWPWKLESAKECVTTHLPGKKKIISVKWVHSHIHLYLLKHESVSQAFVFLRHSILKGRDNAVERRYMCQLLSRVRLFATPWTVARQAPSSMGFSMDEEYGSGLPFPSPGDLPDPGIEPRSPASQADYLSSEPLGKPRPRGARISCSSNKNILIGRRSRYKNPPVFY